jgi:SAM-dependent methyltransferase
MSDNGQVTSSAAEFYDEFFVPALFAEWAPRVVDAAGLQSGMRVADVACGTGVLTVQAARAVAPGGAAVGIDINPGMLAVARAKFARIDWHEAAAEALPFETGMFDAVLSQFGLMFFADKKAALEEMWRVLRPGGRLVVAVWGSLEEAPGYAAVTVLLGRLFGDAIADLLRSPYSLGDPAALGALLDDAGVRDSHTRSVRGEARFPSIRRWMECDVRGWTLADKLDDVQFELLVSEAEVALAPFVTADGSVRFPHPALIATAEKAA